MCKKSPFDGYKFYQAGALNHFGFVPIRHLPKKLIDRKSGLIGSFYYWNNEEKDITRKLDKYSQYSSYDMKAVQGFCLELKFIKNYQEKIKKTKYSSS